MIYECVIKEVSPSISCYDPMSFKTISDVQLTKLADLSRWKPEVGEGVLVITTARGVSYIIGRIENNSQENVTSTVSPLKEGVIMASDGSTAIKRGSSLFSVFEKSIKLVAEKLQILGDGVIQEFKDAKDLAPKWSLTVKDKILKSILSVEPGKIKLNSNDLSTAELSETEVKISTPSFITEAQAKAIIKCSLIKLGQVGASPAVKADAFEVFWNTWLLFYSSHVHGNPLPPPAPTAFTGPPVPNPGLATLSPTTMRSTQVFID